MKKNTLMLLLLLLLALVEQTPAEATPAIYLNPVLGETVVGDSVTFDVQVAALGTANVGSFSFDLSYPSFLQFNSLSFGPYLGAAGDVTNSYTDLPLSHIVVAGSVSHLSDTDLSLMQPDTFDLASLTFIGLQEGFNLMSLRNVSLYDISRNSLNPDIFGDSYVAVDPVPEPATLLLFGSGLVGLFGRRMRISRILG